MLFRRLPSSAFNGLVGTKRIREQRFCIWMPLRMARQLSCKGSISFRRPNAVPKTSQLGIQWPGRDEKDPGTAILHMDAFAHGKTAKLQRVDFVPTAECCSEDFPARHSMAWSGRKGSGNSDSAYGCLCAWQDS